MAEQHYWLSRGVNRRTLLRSAAIAGAVAVPVLAGCNSKKPATSSSAGSAPSGASGQPRRGGTLQFAMDHLNPVLDPHQAASSTIVFLWSNISHHLAGIDPKTGGFTDTEASQSFEQPDKTTMVFKLWPGISWQQTADVPSRTFTAKDVVYNLKRIATNDPRFPRRSLFTEIDSVTAPDDGTVVIKMKHPYAPQLTYLGSAYSVMVNPDAVEKSGGVINRPSTASGIGPFKLQSYDASTGAVLQRDDNYFRKGLPYLDGINVATFTDIQTQLAAFRTGQMHIFAGIAGLPLASEDEIKRSVKGVQMSPWSNAGISGCVGLSFKNKMFQDMRVRQAVSLAIDRYAMMEQAYQGKRAHLRAPVGWAFGDYAIPEAELATLPGYRKDKTADFQQAKQLLAAAGLKTSDIKLETIVSNVEPPSNYETVIAQLNQFGFPITVKLLDPTAYLNADAKGDFAWVWQSGVADPEVDALLRVFNYTNGSRNYTGFSDPAIDALIDKQAQELDHPSRGAITRDVSRRLIDQPNWILTAGQDSLYAAQEMVRDYRVASESASVLATDLTRTWLDPKA